MTDRHTVNLHYVGRQSADSRLLHQNSTTSNIEE